MPIRREEIQHMAELAKLEMDEARLERVAEDLSRILEYMTVLRRMDLADCDPVTLAPAGTPLREDAPDGRGLEPADALAMAPEAEGGFFLVPAVVESREP
jgi:aspartyl-tRNA(Asn)/glutamyl-tRNA(Gln) amidotransferase subunit C